jgi:hypothetical protein
VSSEFPEVDNISNSSQVLHPWIMVLTMALPTPHPTITKVENALGDLLATTRLPHPHHRADGRNTRPARASKPTLAHPTHAANDGCRNLRAHHRRRIMVCGSQYDFAVRFDRNLQLLRLLRLRLQRSSPKRQNPLRQIVRSNCCHNRRPGRCLRRCKADQTRWEIRGISRRGSARQ